jgi:outer membrane receptor protein involved in Fe transport
MKSTLRFLTVSFIALIFSLTSWSQAVTLSGNVKNISSQQVVPAVSVIIKGTTQGTFTDEYGNFKITVPQLPVTLVFSSIGFEAKEIVVDNASSPIQVEFVPGSSLGQEVVVSASRVPERILESPVSIERVSTASIRNAAVPNYYEALANLKGVDLTTSGLLFRTLSTRGFNGSGNLRFNQLVDGMDNQAPGLNFAVGNVAGITELDVDNIELQQGASSALYGSGGVNGTLLITSKSPFKYQGLSFQVKQGIMQPKGDSRSTAPYYDWGLRWAKTIGEKFAFKITSQLIKADDWQAADYRNLLRNNVFSSLKPGDRQIDPNYDGVNVFGDEASTFMNSVSQAIVATASQQALPLVTQQVAALCSCTPTPAMIQSGLVNFLSTNPTTQPFYLGMANPGGNVFTGSSSPFVSRTGYEEKYLVDYNTYNVKLNGGLYYKITSNIEASIIGYFGMGTSVYTGADRYSIKNFKIGQYQAQLKGKNWFLRGYTTQENSGDSYTATTAALFINRAWKSDLDWFQQYTGNYGGARLLGANDAQAHAAARAAAEQGRFLPGSSQFNAAFKQAVNLSINKGGAKFDDATDLYHYEGQYNLSEKIKVVDVIVGASYRVYSLNSNGTIFVDTTGRIKISEFGSYVQVQKKLLNDVLKLTGSLRYDKNENFDGRFTPRATALVRVAPDNNVRLSFQTAYRFPSAQDQYINLLTGGANRLIGGLPEFNTFFKFNSNPAYTSESIVAYRNTVATATPNPTLLKQAQFQVIKPETVRSYEIGYRGLLTRRFLLDVYGYYSRYQEFIGRVAVGRGQSGDPAKFAIELASPFTSDNYSFTVNTANDVKAIGWGISANYQIGKGFEANANISSDKLQDVPADVVTFFNTPKYRFNIGFANNNVGKHWGFNVLYRWQDNVFWEGTFGSGDIPSFGTMDAQITYKVPSIRSQWKLGASNVFNKYYRSAFGNPEVGGLYYVSFGYNVF